MHKNGEHKHPALPTYPFKSEQLLKNLHSAEGKLADSIARFAGSMAFVYFHAFWFGFWILANHGFLKPFIYPFDPFPYGLLTMVVSLEAIFLSTFIMITQHRQALVETYRELEDEAEQKVEEEQHEEFEENVEDIQEDVEDMQQDLNDIKTAIDLIQQKVINLEKTRSLHNGMNGGSPVRVKQ